MWKTAHLIWLSTTINFPRKTCTPIHLLYDYTQRRATKFVNTRLCTWPTHASMQTKPPTRKWLYLLQIVCQEWMLPAVRSVMWHTAQTWNMSLQTYEQESSVLNYFHIFFWKFSLYQNRKLPLHSVQTPQNTDLNMSRRGKVAHLHI